MSEKWAKNERKVSKRWAKDEALEESRNLGIGNCKKTVNKHKIRQTKKRKSDKLFTNNFRHHFPQSAKAKT